MNIYQQYDKHLINGLPIEQFAGRIVVVNNPKDADRAVDFLSKQQLLGMDTETKPTFKKGQTHKVALLQLATGEAAFLFQLKFTNITDSMKDLLENKKIAKVGLSLNDDIRSLNGRRQFMPANFIDIQTCVKKLGIQDMSLQKIYANLFGLKISKAQQLSNWNADILNEKQKQYAALDAYACIRIYGKIMELMKSGGFSLVECPTEHEPQQQ